MYNKEEQLQQKFVSLLKEKMPVRTVSEISKILPLEKEAIYRRLRGEVCFSFVEMATLSSYLGISLDGIANIASPYRSMSYQLHVRDYNELKPIDLVMSNNYIDAINRAIESPHSEFGIAANMLPLHISLMHPPLYRVYLLKWRYQFGSPPKDGLAYSRIDMPEEEIDACRRHLEAVAKIKYTFFIWDSSFFVSLINDINYFYSIRVINGEEMHMLREEMLAVLATLEDYADSGQFASTGNRVDTYISNLNFENNYSYLYSDGICISMSSAYTLGAFTSLDKEACEAMKRWVTGLKRSSNLISGAARRDKLAFFNKQRDILDSSFITD